LPSAGRERSWQARDQDRDFGDTYQLPVAQDYRPVKPSASASAIQQQPVAARVLAEMRCGLQARIEAVQRAEAAPT
jgi:hypothetical protein